MQLEDVEINAEFENLKTRFNEKCSEAESFKSQVHNKFLMWSVLHD